MPERRKVTLDPKKFLQPEGVRLNLLLSSLYLSAFEILKAAIIDGTKEFFIREWEVTDEEIKKWKDVFDGTEYEGTVDEAKKRHLEQIERYEREVGVDFKHRDQFGLIPSCRWLQSIDVLDEGEVDIIRRIRNHRNEIAHELPSFLVGEGFEVNLGFFGEIRRLLKKVDAFWARSTLLLDAETLEEVDVQDVRDEDISSIREVILDVIVDTVADYLGQIASEM